MQTVQRVNHAMERSALSLQPNVGRVNDESAEQIYPQILKDKKCVFECLKKNPNVFLFLFCWVPWSAFVLKNQSFFLSAVLNNTVSLNVGAHGHCCTWWQHQSCLSLMVYCGKPQTPQRRVAMWRHSNCRHW